MTSIKSALCIKLSEVPLLFVEERILFENYFAGKIKPFKRPMQQQINAHVSYRWLQVWPDKLN